MNNKIKKFISHMESENNPEIRKLEREKKATQALIEKGYVEEVKDHIGWTNPFKVVSKGNRSDRLYLDFSELNR